MEDDQRGYWVEHTETTVLGIFLLQFNNHEDIPDYSHGWDEALHVFGAVRGMNIVHQAIGMMQPLLLPDIIDKFEVDLTQKDSQGRTPLIIAIYYTVFFIDSSFHGSGNRNARKFFLDQRREVQCQEGVVAYMLDKGLMASTDEGNDTKLYPAMIKDDDGRLPIHVAANIGLKWSCGMEDIVEANMVGLDTQDPLTGLYPFMLAALGSCADLTSISSMFALMPDVLERI